MSPATKDDDLAKSNSRSLPKWVYWSLPVLLFALIVVYGWWYLDATRPERCFERAMISLADGDAAAFDHELQILGRNPDCAPYRHLLRGAFFLRERQFHAAISELELARVYPNLEPRALVWIGQAQLQLGDNVAAADALHKAIALDPSFDEARQMLVVAEAELQPAHRVKDALAALAANDLARVRQETAQLCETPGGELPCQFFTGVLLLRDGQAAASVDCFDRAAQDPSLRMAALVYASEALYALNRATDAIERLRQALRDEPHSVDAHRLLGSIYFDLGALDQASFHWTQVATAAPNDPRPHRILGLIDKEFSRFAPAVQHYREALRLGLGEPARAEVVAECAECLIALGQYDTALAIVELEPSSPPTDLLKATCYFHLDQFDHAKAGIAPILQAYPENAAALKLQGRIARKQNDLDAAIAAFEQLVKVAPKNVEAQDLLALAYRDAGSTELADRHAALASELQTLELRFADLHRKAAVDVENADLRYQIGLLASDLGQTDVAIHWFRAALALDPNHQSAARALRELTRN